MKIADTATTTDTNSAFTIAATGKAFRILSDGLYSDKIRAIIRELSCNARDSHVAAGNAHPWTMHLPSHDEPWFAVTDYGTGMSHDDVVNIYSRYFASTKTNSNAFIGQLGLGSKSPFSYTKSFTVESRYEGVKNSYRMYFDDSDTPRVDHLGSESTAGTGLTVRFAVVNGHDRWRDKAIEVLRWFDQKPALIGLRVHDEQLVNPDPAYQGPGYRMWRKQFWNGNSVQILMGGVLYPLDTHSIPDMDAKLYYLTDFPMVIEMSIGDCDVAASREGLSYDVRTVVNIRARLDAVRSEIIHMVQNSISGAGTEWAARELWNRYFQGSMGYSMRKLFEDVVLEHNGTDITGGNIEVDTFKLYKSQDHGVRLMPSGIRSVRKHDSFMVSCVHGTKILFDDLKKGGLGRARQMHAAAEHKNVTVLFAPRLGGWEALRAELGYPEVTYTSTLPDVVKQPRNTVTQIWEFNNLSRGGGGKYAWRTIDPATLPSTGKMIYVTLKNWDVISGPKLLGRYGLDNLRGAAVSIKMLKHDDRIFAVRPASVRKLDPKRWVSLHDHLEPQVQNLFAEPKTQALYAAHSDQAQVQNVVPHALNKISVAVDTLRRMVRDPSSEIIGFLASLSEMKAASNIDLNPYRTLQVYYGIDTPQTAERNHTEMEAERIVRKYAMFRHMNLGYSIDKQTIDDLINYIDAVDTAHVFLALSKTDAESEV